MKRTVCVTFFALLVAQAWTLGQAGMSQPIIKNSEDGVSITVHFQQFDASQEYRLGLGAATASLSGSTLDILKDDQPMTMTVAEFEQGYTKDWFSVEPIKVRGFTLKGDSIPGPDGRLTLKITIPKSDTAGLDKIFLVLAKHYGSDRWYLEDGSEIPSSFFP